MGSFVTVEHEEVEHKRHSCKLSTEQILVTNRADKNLTTIGFSENYDLSETY